MNALKQPRGTLVTGTWLLAIMLSLQGVASAFAQSSILHFSRADRIELKRLISIEAQGSVNRLQRLDGQRMPTRVTAKFDDIGRNLLIEVGRGFIPKGTDYTPASVLDQLRFIGNDIRYLLNKTSEVEQIIFLFDGKDRFYYFPREAPKNKNRRQQTCLATRLGEC